MVSNMFGMAPVLRPNSRPASRASRKKLGNTRRCLRLGVVVVTFVAVNAALADALPVEDLPQGVVATPPKSALATDSVEPMDDQQDGVSDLKDFLTSPNPSLTPLTREEEAESGNEEDLEDYYQSDLKKAMITVKVAAEGYFLS